MSSYRPTWDEYFMHSALLISTRSTCPRLSVGAVIVKNNQIIATGYNGSITGEVHCEDTECLIDDGHCIRTVHAEINAILQCARTGTSLKDATIYVTHYPCVNCMKALLQAGIKKIYYLYDYHNHYYCEHLCHLKNFDVIKMDDNKNSKLLDLSHL